MIESLKREIAEHGDTAAIVPIHRLHDIRQDLESLKGSGSLNKFQQYIINDIYQLDAPDAGFKIRSIILVASPGPSSIEMIFIRNGKRIPVVLPASYVGKERTPARIEQYLKAFLTPKGYHVRYAPHLPGKRLAVRNGMGSYGRNNLCYVDGMGSFLNLSLYFSDVPESEDAWQDVRQMDICHTCVACLQNCPTAAITPAKFLIDNERCLSYFNEAGREWDFPDWIDPSSHHALYGCLRCQTVCPINKPYLKIHIEQVEFSEEETDFLLLGKSFDLFPENLRHKVKAFEMIDYLGAIPRNLRVLFDLFSANSS